MNQKWMKILFLHIPKTAGSSFNAIFKTAVPEGRHFEHLEGRRERLERISEDGLPYFVSGHLTFDSIRSYIEREDVYSITILRDPVDQLLSHLKWVKYVGSPQYPAPENVAAPILELARQLFRTPLHDIVTIERLIDLPIGRQLFDNLHVRYMTNAQMDRVDEPHLRRAFENVGKLSFVFVLEDMERALADLRLRIPRIGSIGFENAARINETVELSDRRLHGFFRDLTYYDQRLYDEVRSRSRQLLLATPFET